MPRTGRRAVFGREHGKTLREPESEELVAAGEERPEPPRGIDRHHPVGQRRGGGLEVVAPCADVFAREVELVHRDAALAHHEQRLDGGGVVPFLDRPLQRRGVNHLRHLSVRIGLRGIVGIVGRYAPHATSKRRIAGPGGSPGNIHEPVGEKQAFDCSFVPGDFTCAAVIQRTRGRPFCA
jgi:hypothetical protein